MNGDLKRMKEIGYGSGIRGYHQKGNIEICHLNICVRNSQHDTVTTHRDPKCDDAMPTEKYTYHDGIVSNAARCAHPNTSKLPTTKIIVMGAQNTT